MVKVARGQKREMRLKEDVEGGAGGGATPSTKVRGGEEGSPWKKRKLARRRSAREKAEKGEREKARGEGGGGGIRRRWMARGEGKRKREAIHGCWDLRERASQGRKKGGK